MAPRTVIASGDALDPRLQPYASPKFDLEDFEDEHLNSLTEKGLRALASELAQLREATNTEMERSVFANYSAFIRTAKEIADLQTDLSRCRELLHGISGVHAALSNSASSSQANGNGAQLSEGGVTSFLALDLPLSPPPPVSTAATEALIELTEQLEVLIAEGSLIEALATLERSTRQLAAAQREQEESGMIVLHPADGDDLSPPSPEDPASVSALASTLARQRGALADALADRISERSTPGTQRRAAARGLLSLGEGSRAYTLLLDHHSSCLASDLRVLRSAPVDDAQGMGVYTADVSHAVCSCLARAADDASFAFADEPSRCSAFLTWAHTHVAAWCNRLVCDGGPMGPEAIAHELAACARIVLGHAALLEEHGVRVTPLLARLLRARMTKAVEEELQKGIPTPELLTASDAYLLSGSSAALAALADVLVRVAPLRQQPVVALTSMRGQVTPLSKQQSTKSTSRFPGF